MSTAAIVGGTVAAAGGSIASGIIGSNAAGHAADTQAAAANNAAQLERQTATDALNFNKQQYGNSLSLLSPFYNSGVAANSRLDYLMGLTPNQGLPPGVVNPNAPQSTTGIPGGGFNIGGIDRSQFAPGGAGNPLANDPGLGPVGQGNLGPRFAPMNADGSPGAFNRFGSLMNFNGSGTNNAGVGPQTASTNVGGTAQVPRTDVSSPGTPFPGNPDAHNFGTLGGLNDPNAGGTGPNSFGSLAQGWNQTFQSPTDVTEQNDPGYQFRLKQGQQAVENSAAARGGLFSGGTAKALNDYIQGSASNEYGNVYNRALQNYNTNYNTFTNDQTNEFNRLMALQGGGQTSANNLSASGLTAAGNAANIGLTASGQIGQQLNNAGAATASGYIGGANAINGAIGGATNSLSTLALLNMLKGNQGTSTAGF